MAWVVVDKKELKGYGVEAEVPPKVPWGIILGGLGFLALLGLVASKKR